VSKSIAFRVDDEQEKIVNAFKKALIRKYGKIHGVFSTAIIDAIQKYMQLDPAFTHIKKPQKFTCFHRRMASIWNDLPGNGTSVGRNVVEMLIKKHAGHHPATIAQYWKELLAWEVIVPAGGFSFRRGPDREWLREALDGS